MKRNWDIYFNSHTRKYSIVNRSLGMVCQSDDKLELHDVVLVVQPAGKQRVIATGRKNVHAFLRCAAVVYQPDTVPVYNPLDRVTYNPYRDDTFVRTTDYTPVVSAALLYAEVDPATRTPRVYICQPLLEIEDGNA